MSVKKVSTILVTAFLVMTMLSVQTRAAGPLLPMPERIGGLTQYDTAAQIARAGWSNAEQALLAVGTVGNSYDALSAGPLAAQLDAPILLTEGDALTEVTKAALVDLHVGEVYIIGGPGVIKPTVETALQALKIKTKRIYGEDASDTSVAVAKAMGKPEGVVLAGGEGQDALSIAPVAADLGYPILYTGKERAAALPQAVSAYLAEVKGTLKTAYIVGGTGIITDAQAAQLPVTAQRFGGIDAYDTNVQVITGLAAYLRFDQVFVANGRTMVDALAGAPLAAARQAALVLTDQGVVKAAEVVNNRLNPQSVVTALGGEGAVPAAAWNKVAYQAGPAQPSAPQSPSGQTVSVTKAVIDLKSRAAANLGGDTLAFKAKVDGEAGNGITLTVTAPSVNNFYTTMEVTGRSIVVNPETNGAGAPIITWYGLKLVLESDPRSADLIEVTESGNGYVAVSQKGTTVGGGKDQIHLSFNWPIDPKSLNSSAQISFDGKDLGSDAQFYWSDSKTLTIIPEANSTIGRGDLITAIQAKTLGGVPVSLPAEGLSLK